MEHPVYLFVSKVKSVTFFLIQADFENKFQFFFLPGYTFFRDISMALTYTCFESWVSLLSFAS